MDKSTVLSTTLTEQDVDTIRRIRAWKNRQIIHMAAFTESELWESMPEKEEDGTITNCWNIKLQLPSSLSAATRAEYCSPALVAKEKHLRVAVAYDSISMIRSLLQKEWWLTGRKLKHVSGPGQKKKGKMNAAIRTLVEQRDLQVERYKRNWNALHSLDPNGSWSKTLKALHKNDIKMLAEDEGKGEGRRKPTWIWRIKGAASISDKDVYYGMYS